MKVLSDPTFCWVHPRWTLHLDEAPVSFIWDTSSFPNKSNGQNGNMHYSWWICLICKGWHTGHDVPYLRDHQYDSVTGWAWGLPSSSSLTSMSSVKGRKFPLFMVTGCYCPADGAKRPNMILNKPVDVVFVKEDDYKNSWSMKNILFKSVTSQNKLRMRLGHNNIEIKSIFWGII